MLYNLEVAGPTKWPTPTPPPSSRLRQVRRGSPSLGSLCQILIQPASDPPGKSAHLCQIPGVATDAASAAVLHPLATEAAAVQLVVVVISRQ